MTDLPVVLVVVKGLGLGGAERLVVESARQWDRDSFDYRVAMLLPSQDALLDTLEDQQVQVLRPPADPGSALSTMKWLRSVVRTIEPDLIHAHLPLPGVMARLVATCPVVYTEHNIVDSYHPLTRIFNRLTYRRNRCVIAVSEAVGASIERYPASRRVVIPNAVSCQPIPDARERVGTELGLGVDDLLVVHVGNIRPGKGQWDLVEAAKAILRARQDVFVVSVGAEEIYGELDRLRDSLTRAGIGDRMRFMGRRSDALVFTAAADVFVNPSQVEGLPLAVLEAMALERPIVATRAGGVPEAIVDTVTGLLVEAGRPEDLAVAVLDLLADPIRRGRLGDAAGRSVAEKFAVERNVDAIETIYRTVLSSP